MNVGWCAVEMGTPGSDQLPHGHGVLDGRDGLDGLDVTTAEIPVQPEYRRPVLADAPPSVAGSSDAPVSINFATSELPFQQPAPRTVAVGSAGRDWRAAIADEGKWPLVALAAAAVLVAVFAAFISRNGQSLSGESEVAETLAKVESASESAVAADRINGTAERATTGAAASTETEDADGSTGRATGTLGAGEGSGFHSGHVVEPDRSLTGPAPDWVPTTVATVARPAPEETSTTARPATTDSTPSTVATSTTAQTDTTTETTASTTTEAAPDGPTVRALGPGTGDAQNPIVVGSGRLTLEAEGSDESMRYRFILYVKNDDGEWRRVDRSRWRFRSTWTIDTDRFEGRTVRWNVVGRTGFRNTTDESAPLYFRVDGESSDDD